jgi:hypothetical protein
LSEYKYLGAVGDGHDMCAIMEVLDVNDFVVVPDELFDWHQRLWIVKHDVLLACDTHHLACARAPGDIASAR